MSDPTEYHICNTSIPSLAYECNYCGSTFCKDHRLPENHDCLGLAMMKQSDQKWGLGLLEDEKDIEEPFDADEAVELLAQQQKLEHSESDPDDEPLSTSEGTSSPDRGNEYRTYTVEEARDRAREVIRSNGRKYCRRDVLKALGTLDPFQSHPSARHRTAPPRPATHCTAPSRLPNLAAAGFRVAPARPQAPSRAYLARADRRSAVIRLSISLGRPCDS